MRYTIRPLEGSTWAVFAELTERNNGVYGGCWCMGYHPEVSRTDTAQNRAGKERRVLEGRAHAALVIDEDGSAQGWCQYGSPAATRPIAGRRPFALRAGDIRSCPVIVRRLSFHQGTSTFTGIIWWLPTEGGGRDAP